MITRVRFFYAPRRRMQETFGHFNRLINLFKAFISAFSQISPSVDLDTLFFIYDCYSTFLYMFVSSLCIKKSMMLVHGANQLDMLAHVGLDAEKLDFISCTLHTMMVTYSHCIFFTSFKMKHTGLRMREAPKFAASRGDFPCFILISKHLYIQSK
ncbi:hypothetical protein DFH28DRAFT_233056 [Melampsora americana]|nr:hypothetical protein DFH28DRAFT_233056 [Melampsora americana]